MEGTNVFEEKLAGLLEEAKKKKNVLEYQEIISCFGADQPTSDQMDQLFDFLEQSKVDIIRMDSAQELDPDLFIEEEINLEEEEEIDVEHLDLSVPEGVSLEDPVRMYPVSYTHLVTGTSFAAPFVAGSAALLMQWGIVDGNDPFLYGEKVKAYLARGARHLPGYEVWPNPQLGYGALCVRDSLP